MPDVFEDAAKAYLGIKSDDVSDLLDRMRGGIGTQESGNNYKVRPNVRTSATGKFQVLPANIPNWTKKHYGKALSQQEFQNDPKAQDAVFNGEMSGYLKKARSIAPDDDTAIRMAAAAWYGGQGAMHKYDNPTRFRPNEPSFREYTSNVLKNSQEDAFNTSAKAYLNQDPFEASAAEYLQTPQEPEDSVFEDSAKQYLEGAPVMPSTPPPVAPQLMRPVPEGDATIALQLETAADPSKKERAGVLTTTPEQNALFGNRSDFKPFQVPEGTLWINLEKAKKVLKLKSDEDIQQYLEKNHDVALIRFLGKAESVADTSGNQAAVTTETPEGTEITSSIVTTPEKAKEQVEIDRKLHPEAVTKVVPSQQVIKTRTESREVPGTEVAVDENGNPIAEQPFLPPQEKQIAAKDVLKLNAVSDTLQPPKDLTEQQAAEYVKSQLSAKYGADFSGFKFLSGYHPGNPINVTYGGLKSAGVDIDPIVSQKVAENRTENPTLDLRTEGNWVENGEKAKEDGEKLNEALGPELAGAVAAYINTGGNTFKSLAGALKVIAELNPAKGDSMAAAAGLKPYRPGEDIVNYLKNISAATSGLVSKTGRKYQDVATEDDTGYLEGRPIEKERWSSKGSKALGAIGDLPRIALYPGGPIFAFGIDSALQAAAEGEDVDWGKVKKEGAKGGALGAVSMFAPGAGKLLVKGEGVATNALREGITLGTLGVGTYTVSRAMGDTPDQAFDNAVLFSAFHAVNKIGEAVKNIPIRVKDSKGNEAVIEIKGDKVKTLDPETEAKAQIVIPEGPTQNESGGFREPPPVVKKTKAEAEEAIRESSKEESPKVTLETDKVTLESQAIPKKSEKADVEAPNVSRDTSAKPPVTAKELKPVIPKGVMGETPKTTSTKNAVVEAERTERNLSPVEKEAKRSFGTVWEDAKETLKNDPRSADDLVASLSRKPRSLSDTENALLLHKRIEARGAFDRAAKEINENFENPLKQMDARARLARASDELTDIDRVSTQAGTESGRSLSARRMMANEDYTLASLETRKRAVNGGRPLTETERGELQKLADEYKTKSDALEATLSQRDQDLAAMKTRAELAEARKEQIRSRPAIERAERIATKLREAAESDREWLKKRGAVFTAGIDPAVMIRLARIGASHIADVGLDFAKWSDKMVAEFGEKIEPHLKDIYEKAQDLANRVAPGWSDKQRLEAFKKRGEKRIIELEQKIEAQDFSKKTRKPLDYDREAGELQLDINRLKRKFDSELTKDRLRNRSKGEKVQDFAANWARMSFLSWPSTLAKLASAAAQRAIYAPIEEAVGAAYSKALPGLAKRSPSEAGLNVKAEAKTFTTGIMKGMKDAYQQLRMKDSDLNVQYGKREFMPPSNKFDAVMQYFGALHGALKAPVKRMGFERSMEKRTAHAIKNGVDVSDPMVQMGLGLEAYKDANRQIFMQDNRMVNAYKRFVQTLEAPKKETGKPSATGKLAATGLRITFPVIKIPVNIAGEIVQYATGLASGSVKLAKAYRKGIEHLAPEEADLIMRQLKKGTVGPALILLGYYNPDAIGGYYQPGQKRDEKDVKFGSIKIFGQNILSLFLHNPATEMLQIGATIRRVSDSKFKKDDEESRGLLAGLIAASTGVAEEIPFVKQTIEAGKALDPRTQDDFISEFIKSRAVPGLSQWTANKLDTDAQGETVKRKPESFFQHIESGIPGLRKYVPEKSPTSEGVSDEVRELQLKKSRIAKEFELVEKAKANGEEPDEKVLESLKDKLDRKMKAGKLTNAEAEKANELLGTDEYEGQMDDKVPDLEGKYGKNAEGLIDKVTTWAEAIGTDPVDAFDKLLSGEYIARMENGVIIVKRMDRSASDAERKRLGGGGKAVKLEHVLPLSLGGKNIGNVKLVTTEQHDSWTPVEVYLAGALHNKVIDGAKAKRLILDLKNDKITRADVIREVGLPFPEEP